MLEARNFSNPILSNEVAQCGVRMRYGILRARGTLLIDYHIVACLQHAIHAPHSSPSHTALHFVSLMWGYWDIVPLSREVRFPLSLAEMNAPVILQL